MIPSFQQNEQKVRRQAMQIRMKLVEKRDKKQQQYEKLIKQQLIKQYQLKFNMFKQQIDDYTTSQLSSLDLIKQFRLGEITEFESKIAEFIKALDTQQRQLSGKKQQLEESLSSAMEFLQHKKQKQIQEKVLMMEKQLEQLVRQYQERIQIE